MLCPWTSTVPISTRPTAADKVSRGRTEVQACLNNASMPQHDPNDAATYLRSDYRSHLNGKVNQYTAYSPASNMRSLLHILRAAAP
jgi:hypothetical protein